MDRTTKNKLFCPFLILWQNEKERNDKKAVVAGQVRKAQKVYPNDKEMKGGK